MAALRHDTTMTEERAGSAFVLEVHGEVDLTSSGELRKRLRTAIEGGARRLLVDLGDVTFIDSIAMAGIIGAQRRLPPDGRLAIVAHHPYVLLVLEAVGLNHLVNVFATRADAEDYLS